ERDRLTEELIRSTGLAAAQLAKELHDKSAEIEALEEKTLTEMETLESLQAERKILRSED
ncbi:MAG TPA: hypothetical protein PL182_04690, partial [Pseudobdellovibrionaceae bacterium]|nr:hypothetical protein [Pseudobdellovibrionaceae bacterium]